MRVKVYLAGPITKGDRVDHLAAAMKAFRTLERAGFAPMMPQYSMFTAYIFPEMTHADYMAVDLAWVSVSDAVLRLPGESKGADMEEECARRHFIPVFYDVGSLVHRFKLEGKVP